ncbi:MAG TPA: hypothetical protein VHV10_11420 [Ktedonobacteraceae bacterium]|nr:hypothetical protein [Ktedonobacteraceae bacterium]
MAWRPWPTTAWDTSPSSERKRRPLLFIPPIGGSVFDQERSNLLANCSSLGLDRGVIILYGCSAGTAAVAIEPVILIVSPVKVLGANPYNVYGT